MLDALHAVIGIAPAGYEWLEYCVLAITLLFILKVVIDVFFNIFRAVMKW